MIFEPVDNIQIPIKLIIEAIKNGEINCVEDLTEEQLKEIPKTLLKKLSKCTDDID
jgi:hypothetical protein